MKFSSQLSVALFSNRLFFKAMAFFCQDEMQTHVASHLFLTRLFFLCVLHIFIPIFPQAASLPVNLWVNAIESNTNWDAPAWLQNMTLDNVTFSISGSAETITVQRVCVCVCVCSV